MKGEKNGMNILMTLANPFTHDPRVYNEAKSLLKAGHKVTVLAWDRKGLYPLTEVKDKINIVRVRNTKLMELIPHEYFRFPLWWREAYKKALKPHKKEIFDIVHCHDYSALPIGIKLKKKKNLLLVYDAHEIWGYMVASNLPKVLCNYFLNEEKRHLKYLDGFIIAEDKYADYYNKFYDKELTPILNCKHLISKNYETSNNKVFTLLYLGSLEKNRFLLELVDVVREISNVKCIIGGAYSDISYLEELKNRCSQASNVDFIGRIPMSDVVPMTKKSDVVVCKLNPVNINTKYATANKQFEAMVCGRPIIGTKGTRIGELTEQEKCGLVIDYTKEALRDAIIKLRDSPKLCEELGRNALKAAIDKYNWELVEKKLLKLYEKLKEKNE